MTQLIRYDTTVAPHRTVPVASTEQQIRCLRIAVVKELVALHCTLHHPRALHVHASYPPARYSNARINASVSLLPPGVGRLGLSIHVSDEVHAQVPPTKCCLPRALWLGPAWLPPRCVLGDVEAAT